MSQQVETWKFQCSKGHGAASDVSSQSTYKINSGCPYYEASIASNPKLLNDFESSKEQLETVYGGIMEEVNELRLQLASKKISFCNWSSKQHPQY